MSYLVEGDFFECLWAAFQHGVEGVEDAEHAVGVVVTEVEPGCFLEAFVPELVPQNGHSNQLLADLQRVISRYVTLRGRCGGCSEITIMACWTRTGLCSHMFFRILLAALCRFCNADLVATVNG